MSPLPDNEIIGLSNTEHRRAVRSGDGVGNVALTIEFCPDGIENAAHEIKKEKSHTFVAPQGIRRLMPSSGRCLLVVEADDGWRASPSYIALNRILGV